MLCWAFISLSGLENGQIIVPIGSESEPLITLVLTLDFNSKNIVLFSTVPIAITRYIQDTNIFNGFWGIQSTLPIGFKEKKMYIPITFNDELRQQYPNSVGIFGLSSSSFIFQLYSTLDYRQSIIYFTNEQTEDMNDFDELILNSSQPVNYELQRCFSEIPISINSSNVIGYYIDDNIIPVLATDKIDVFQHIFTYSPWINELKIIPTFKYYSSLPTMLGIISIIISCLILFHSSFKQPIAYIVQELARITLIFLLIFLIFPILFHRNHPTNLEALIGRAFMMMFICVSLLSSIILIVFSFSNITTKMSIFWIVPIEHLYIVGFILSSCFLIVSTDLSPIFITIIISSVLFLGLVIKHDLKELKYVQIGHFLFFLFIVFVYMLEIFGIERHLVLFIQIIVMASSGLIVLGLIFSNMK